MLTVRLRCAWSDVRCTPPVLRRRSRHVPNSRIMSQRCAAGAQMRATGVVCELQVMTMHDQPANRCESREHGQGADEVLIGGADRRTRGPSASLPCSCGKTST